MEKLKDAVEETTEESKDIDQDPEKKKARRKRKPKSEKPREQDNSHLRGIGNWLPGPWKQTDPPTKPVS